MRDDAALIGDHTAAEDYLAWRDLQNVLEARDAEWWVEAQETDEDE